MHYKLEKIDPKAFLERFDQVYSDLYEKRDKVVGFKEAVDEFDRMAENGINLDFIEMMANEHGDPFASDREAAAFVLTMMEMIGERFYVVPVSVEGYVRPVVRAGNPLEAMDFVAEKYMNADYGFLKGVTLRFQRLEDLEGNVLFDIE